ncbi:hypothetical protein QJS66_09245 [Kocuria rhizophila]|nr:hypothetical protein QJS66_09245 [Kocuria rhizophila]
MTAAPAAWWCCATPAGPGRPHDSARWQQIRHLHHQGTHGGPRAGPRRRRRGSGRRTTTTRDPQPLRGPHGGPLRPAGRGRRERAHATRQGPGRQGHQHLAGARRRERPRWPSPRRRHRPRFAGPTPPGCALSERVHWRFHPHEHHRDRAGRHNHRDEPARSRPGPRHRGADRGADREPCRRCLVARVRRFRAPGTCRGRVRRGPLRPGARALGAARRRTPGHLRLLTEGGPGATAPPDDQAQRRAARPSLLGREDATRSRPTPGPRPDAARILVERGVGGGAVHAGGQRRRAVTADGAWHAVHEPVTAPAPRWGPGQCAGHPAAAERGLPEPVPARRGGGPRLRGRRAPPGTATVVPPDDPRQAVRAHQLGPRAQVSPQASNTRRSPTRGARPTMLHGTGPPRPSPPSSPPRTWPAGPTGDGVGALARDAARPRPSRPRACGLSSLILLTHCAPHRPVPEEHRDVRTHHPRPGPAGPGSGGNTESHPRLAATVHRDGRARDAESLGGGRARPRGETLSGSRRHRQSPDRRSEGRHPGHPRDGGRLAPAVDFVRATARRTSCSSSRLRRARTEEHQAALQPRALPHEEAVGGPPGRLRGGGRGRRGRGRARSGRRRRRTPAGRTVGGAHPRLPPRCATAAGAATGKRALRRRRPTARTGAGGPWPASARGDPRAPTGIAHTTWPADALTNTVEMGVDLQVETRAPRPPRQDRR